MNIWKDTKRPIFILAPMDDVTDTVFRRIIASTARPDIFFTEFANADGLQSPGRTSVLRKLRFTTTEQPLVAQLWGMKPDNYLKSAREIVGMGFSGIDINMGCPVKKVVNMGACSALMKNRSLAAQIIGAVKKGSAGKVPVSVKTRIGFNEPDMDWIRFLLGLDIDALIIHGRTVKQQSKTPNDWQKIGQAAELSSKLAPETAIIGNGDVVSRRQGEELARKYDLSGIMIGRGVFKDPYVFSKVSPWEGMSAQERINLYIKHIKLFEKTWGGGKNPASLKKFAKIYVNGFEGASNLRSEVMDSGDIETMIRVLKQSRIA